MQKKQSGRRVILKVGEKDEGAVVETSRRVKGRKAMSPITRFLEEEGSPSNNGIFDKSPKSPPGLDVGSPGAVSSQSVTSEDNPMLEPGDCLNLPTRGVKEVEQRWSLNDTLEMCLSEREKEELFQSEWVNEETPSGTAFGELEDRGTGKNSLRGKEANESSRNQLLPLQKLSVT